MKGIGFKTMREWGGPLGVADMQAEGSLLPLVASTTGMETGAIKRQAMVKGVATHRRLRESAVHLITQADERYPRTFRNLPLDSQPLWLFCRGDLSLLQRPSVAVVGTRDPSIEGIFLTQYAARAVQEMHSPLVSGLALGVDAIAHETALSASVPNISILGTGILRPYPARNSWMADAIVASGGLLISEYFPDAEPAAEQFVWRNRLQAALASCVIATQWKKSSGTAHTIRYAKSFGRQTINLVPNGMSISPEHGVAQTCFEVPRQHTDFVQCMSDALSQWPDFKATGAKEREAKVVEQPQLFG